MKTLRLYRAIHDRTYLLARADQVDLYLTYIEIIFRYNHSFKLSPLRRIHITEPNLESRTDSRAKCLDESQVELYHKTNVLKFLTRVRNKYQLKIWF